MTAAAAAAGAGDADDATVQPSVAAAGAVLTNQVRLVSTRPP